MHNVRWDGVSGGPAVGQSSVTAKLEGGVTRLRPRQFVRISGALSGVMLIGLISTGFVAADAPSTRIVVEPPVVHPGEEVTIHGTFLWTDADVSVSIVGRAGAARIIGTAATLGDGSLEMRARVPDDMPAGIFRVVVTTSSGDTVDVELVIDPPFPFVPTAAAVAAILAVSWVLRSTSRRRREADPRSGD